MFTTRHVFRVFLFFFKTKTTTTHVKKFFLLFLQIVFTPRRESDRDDSNAETNQSRGLLREIDLDSIIRGISRAARKLLEQIRSSPKQLSIKKAFFRKPSKILPYFSSFDGYSATAQTLSHLLLLDRLRRRQREREPLLSDDD